MDDCLKILDSEVPLDEYFETENVSDEVRGKIDSVDALIIPMKHSENEFYFAKDTIDFVKFCRQKIPNTHMMSLPKATLKCSHCIRSIFGSR